MVLRDSRGRFLNGNRDSPVIGKFGKNNSKYKPIGSEYIDSISGDVMIKVSENNWIKKKRVVWEQQYEALKSNETILFLDGNKLNCAISNFKKVSLSEKLRMSRRNLITNNQELTMANLNKLRLEDAINEKESKI